MSEIIHGGEASQQYQLLRNALIGTAYAVYVQTLQELSSDGKVLIDEADEMAAQLNLDTKTFRFEPDYNMERIFGRNNFELVERYIPAAAGSLRTETSKSQFLTDISAEMFVLRLKTSPSLMSQRTDWSVLFAYDIGPLAVQDGQLLSAYQEVHPYAKHVELDTHSLVLLRNKYGAGAIHQVTPGEAAELRYAVERTQAYLVDSSGQRVL